MECNKNDSSTYRINDRINGDIISFRNVTFIEQVQSSAPSSLVDDTD